MRVLGVLVDGELFNAQGLRVSEPRVEPSRAVTPVPPLEVSQPENRNLIPQTNDVLEAATLLARVIRVAHGLGRDDQFRVRELVSAAHSTLSATTRIDPRDQRLFEAALRNAAREDH